MAEGVPFDKIYPIDMKRALDMLKKIKEHSIYYNVIADGQNVVPQRRGPSRPAAQHPRLAAQAGHQGRLRLDLEPGHLMGRLLDGAQRRDGRKGDLGFHQLSLDPAGQAELLKTNGYGPSNPEAAKLLDAEWNKVNPGAPENYAKMLPGGIAWYAKNATQARQEPDRRARRLRERTHHV